MFPVEAYKDQQVRILHRAGDQQFVVTLQLLSGEDAQEKVLRPFQQGHLPSCLYRSTLEYVVVAIRESLCDDEALPHSLQELPSPPVDASGRVNRLALGIDPILDHCLFDLEERQWPQLLPSIHHFSLPSDVLRSDDTTFWFAYDFLLRHRPAFFRTIGTLEESYLKGIRELQYNLRRAISQLQMRQSMEMEQVRVQAEKAALQVEDESEPRVSRNVHDLVAQHVSELDAVELHWRTEIEELKVKQKESYCDLVVDFFEQEIGQLRQAQSSLAPCGAVITNVNTPLSPEELARPLAKRPCVGLPSQPSGCEADATGKSGNPECRGDLKLRAEMRTVFGQRRVFFLLRLFVGDITDLLPDVSPSDALDEDSENFNAGSLGDGAGPQLPPELVGLGSYGQRHFVQGTNAPVEGVGWPLPWGNSHYAGQSRVGTHAAHAGRAVSYSAVFRSPSLRFWGPPCLPPPVELSPNAYADHLRGLVIPTPENLKFEVTQAVMLREFASRCNRVTDLHFAPLAEQLQSVHRATASSPLKHGDYFCTRHSNLDGVMQVAFHLLTGSSESPASDEVPAAVHRAVRRIVSDCHRCHVVELTLPLLLLDIGTTESSLSYAVAQRRSENVLRALKGALTRLAEELAPSELPELQVVNLVLPTSSAQSISTGIPSVAESSLTFLRNSFQCV